MARSIRHKTNVDAPDSDYVFGRVRDDDGSNNGTPVDENLLGDQLQFFEKIMFESGLAFNELPDNAYSGFQLFQALQKVIDDNTFSTAVTSFGTNWSNSSNFGFKLQKSGSTVKMRGSIKCTSTPSEGDTMFTLPSNCRPSVTRICPVAGFDAGHSIGYYGYVIEITSGGLVKIHQSGAAAGFAGSADFVIYLDGVEFYL